MMNYIVCNALVLAVVAPAAPPPMKDVIAAIADREEAIKAFSVRLDIDSVSSFAGTQKSDFRVTVIADDLGRYRIEGERQPSGAAPERIVQVFDGRLRSDAWGGGDMLTHGLRGSNANYLIPLLPFALCWDFYTERTSEYLEKWKAATLREEHWTDGPGEPREVWAIETTPVVNASGVTRKSEVYIDHARGCVIVRKIKWYRSAGATDWVKNWSFEAREHREAAPGVWVPSAVEENLWFVSADNRVSPATQIKCRASDWSINPSINDDIFSFAFPAGVTVTDETTDKTYLSGAITDPAVAAQVEAGKKLLGQRRWSWLGTTGVLAAAVIAAAFVMRFLFRKEAGWK